MKKFLVIVMCLCTAVAFACPPHGGHHGRHHHHHRGHDSVWLAAGITSIAANGISILNTVTTPRYVAATPVVTTPVVVPQTVNPQIEYTVPQVVYPQPVAVPVVQTVLVPIQVNGRIFYHQEQRIIYTK